MHPRSLHRRCGPGWWCRCGAPVRLLCTVGGHSPPPSRGRRGVGGDCLSEGGKIIKKRPLVFRILVFGSPARSPPPGGGGLQRSLVPSSKRPPAPTSSLRTGGHTEIATRMPPSELCTLIRKGTSHLLERGPLVSATGIRESSQPAPPPSNQRSNKDFQFCICLIFGLGLVWFLFCMSNALVFVTGRRTPKDNKDRISKVGGEFVANTELQNRREVLQDTPRKWEVHIKQ